MSIKSDYWLTSQNTPPTHRLIENDEFGMSSVMRTELIKPPFTWYQQQAIANWCPSTGREKIMGKEYAVALTDSELLEFKPIIEPFFSHPVRYVYKDTGKPCPAGSEDEATDQVRRVISFGTSSYGYDVRLSADQEHIKVFTNVFAHEINPKKMTDANFATPLIQVDEEGAKYVLIPAHSYLQAPTMEYFRVPRDVLIIVVGKSTYARSGVICNVTPIEPEFEGNVVIEVSNSTSSPVRCYLEEGIAQFLFVSGDGACRTSYKDKAGKYQGQTGLQYAKV